MKKYFLALDPSMVSTGWALIATVEEVAEYVDGGFIDTRRADNPLRVIREELRRIVELYPIEKTVLKERMFYKNNLATFALAKVHGIVEEVLDGYNVVDVPSSSVRKMIGGHGRANKDSVAEGVRRFLHLSSDFEFPRSDVSDAASVCLTYLFQAHLLPVIA